MRIPVGRNATLSVVASGWCPATIEAHAPSQRERTREELIVNLFMRLEVPNSIMQAGFDQAVSLEARTRCDPEAALRWSQTSGPALDDTRLRIDAGGRRVALRTHPLTDLITLSPYVGVVALSRAERAEYRLVVEGELGGRVERRSVRVVAAPASTGVFQVGTGGDVYLNGGEQATYTWAIEAKPEGSRAAMQNTSARVGVFRPDLFGEYVVTPGGGGPPISIQAGPYEEVPRDCGREPCHKAEEDGWATTLHAATFRRGLDGTLGPSFSEACWSCHATGVDPGVQNGGLLETAEAVGWRAPTPGPGVWDRAPRKIRRHASVWCSACHGPGRILRPQFHWEYGAKYFAGVCARCHDGVNDPDSPHRSWQVREWRAAPMATLRTPQDPAAPSRRRECAGCHTAQGFIAWTSGTRALPDPQSAAAITCAACHDPHSGTNPRALRVYDTVDWIAGRPAEGLAATALCATCHRSRLEANQATAAAPHAPQADVLLGRGSVLLSPHAMAELDAPHVANGGCIACHLAPPAEESQRSQLGGHTFSVRDLQSHGDSSTTLNARACTACHGEGEPTQAIGGIRDWDGDRRADNIGQDFNRALQRIRTKVEARITLAHVSDSCGPPNAATGFAEVDALLVLRRSDGRLLGDCDGDGRLRAPERPVTIAQLSKRLRAVVWDLALVVKDRSRGRHNPAFTFAVLRAVERASGDDLRN